MKKWKHYPALLLSMALILILAACGGNTADNAETNTDNGSSQANTRTITDSAGRTVEIPETVERIVCVNVGALRYTCYMQAQDLVIGVEDYEKEQSISRGYNYVNFELFQDLPVVGNNGEHYPEEIISADPDVIVMSAYDDSDADSLQEKTGIPVVVVPGSDSMMDEGAYETFRIMGELYGKEDRAQELIDYMDSIKEICIQFGFSESKVKSMLHRTRQKLRLQLEQEGH